MPQFLVDYIFYNMMYLVMGYVEVHVTSYLLKVCFTSLYYAFGAEMYFACMYICKRMHSYTFTVSVSCLQCDYVFGGGGFTL